MNIFVGNLPFSATETDVKTLFEGFGNVVSVVIVKDRKGVESRGFGFLEMSDDQQAQAAINALNSKEFMGRPLNISPVRPKSEEEREAERKSKLEARMKTKAQALLQEQKGQRDAWFSAVYKKTEGYSGYKRGRRTRSYVTRRAAAGIEEPLGLKPKPHDNPMRWRKKKDQGRPWQKSEAAARPGKKVEAGARPWQKSETGSRPWQKSKEGTRPSKRSDSGVRPWQKSEGGARPWKKPEAGAARPWKRPESGTRPWKKPESGARPWKKPETGSRPWQKPEAGPRPWKKPESGPRTWRKSNARPPRPRFKGQGKPGGHARSNH
jgi:hypothetical protein